MGLSAYNDKINMKKQLELETMIGCVAVLKYYEFVVDILIGFDCCCCSSKDQCGDRMETINCDGVQDRNPFTPIKFMGCLVFASITILVVSNVLKYLNFEQPDNVIMVMMPFSLLNAEGMPDWFTFGQKKVISGSILLIVWALASALLTFAFSSNLRAILLSPVMETFADTSAQIVEKNLEEGIQVALQEKNVVLLSSNYQVMLEQIWLRMNKSILFHFSRQEELTPAKYKAMILGRNFVWNEVFDLHVLICYQAGFTVADERATLKDPWLGPFDHANNVRYIRRKYQGRVSDEMLTMLIEMIPEEHNVETLNLQHMTIPFIIFGVGLTTATLGTKHFNNLISVRSERTVTPPEPTNPAEKPGCLKKMGQLRYIDISNS
ncbi:uncharacterized protein LOC111709146 [Eurytemora carolleeae]|uniref:uncharacterized protein LOC111709146 n=1 Tax=Eurytemora carolleeae TaxID=1294199 RepID=UPI000C769D88|nr:uncharacterized protein LOC111709146 [Eurytemora carolleeae]|eukprot:XP_023338523.1 uncharacterized protein LOC111709146 [Eurytemora affinis]